jgi:uncharacterized protein YodC (DUF2158 family)
LRLVASSDEYQDDREPPLRLGDVVQLNSGGPLSLVVDIRDCNTVTIAWRDNKDLAEEAELPRLCVHRARFDGF